MRGRLPLDKNKLDKVSDIYFNNRKNTFFKALKYAQQVLAQQPEQPQPELKQVVPSSGISGGGMPGVGGQPTPLPNMIDRTQDVKEIISNYEKLEKLVSSNRKMWQKMLDSNGQDTGGFLDDPNDWGDKQWADAVKATERLVRDANNALMKTGETGMEDELVEDEFAEEGEIEMIEGEEGL